MLNLQLFDGDLSDDVAKRVRYHRNQTFLMFQSKYVESLPILIGYEGLEDRCYIDPVQLEAMLRFNYQGVAIGMTKLGLMILGTVNTDSSSYTQYPYTQKRLTYKDINLIVDKSILSEDSNEMTFYDGYTTGSFVVLYNKPFSTMSDYQIIRLYAERLAEIAGTRFSLYMQSKVTTVLTSGYASDDMKILAQKLYNGEPYLETTEEFDPEENVLTLDLASNVISLFPELKREYQNNISELNNLLGISALGVDKEAGVSQIEAQSNKGFQSMSENVYLKARNEKLRHLNKKYGTSLKATLSEKIYNELSSLEKIQIEEG